VRLDLSVRQRTSAYAIESARVEQQGSPAREQAAAPYSPERSQVLHGQGMFAAVRTTSRGPSNVAAWIQTPQ